MGGTVYHHRINSYLLELGSMLLVLFTHGDVMARGKLDVWYVMW
jgi:hypothetical protein